MTQAFLSDASENGMNSSYLCECSNDNIYLNAKIYSSLIFHIKRYTSRLTLL